MKMICDVPNEVIKSVRMGTWCGSSVAEKMIANGIPLEQIRAEIETKYGQCSICEYDSDYGGRWYQVGDIADILQILDKYKADRSEEDGTST